MKPRQFCRDDGKWVCVCNRWCGCGDTRFLSWMSWLKLSLSRYEVEA